MSTRRPTAAAARAAAGALGHLERSEAWNGLRAGDQVVVTGLRMRGARWEFRAHVHNAHTGEESVEVIGGRPGDRKIRTVEPDRIYAVRGRGRSGATAGGGPPAGELSLADAPQLPLG